MVYILRIRYIHTSMSHGRAVLWGTWQWCAVLGGQSVTFQSLISAGLVPIAVHCSYHHHAMIPPGENSLDLLTDVHCCALIKPLSFHFVSHQMSFLRHIRKECDGEPGHCDCVAVADVRVPNIPQLTLAVAFEHLRWMLLSWLMH